MTGGTTDAVTTARLWYPAVADRRGAIDHQRRRDGVDFGTSAACSRDELRDRILRSAPVAAGPPAPSSSARPEPRRPLDVAGDKVDPERVTGRAPPATTRPTACRRATSSTPFARWRRARTERPWCRWQQDARGSLGLARPARRARPRPHRSPSPGGGRAGLEARSDGSCTVGARDRPPRGDAPREPPATSTEPTGSPPNAWPYAADQSGRPASISRGTARPVGSGVRSWWVITFIEPFVGVRRRRPSSTVPAGVDVERPRIGHRRAGAPRGRVHARGSRVREPPVDVLDPTFPSSPYLRAHASRCGDQTLAVPGDPLELPGRLSTDVRAGRRPLQARRRGPRVGPGPVDVIRLTLAGANRTSDHPAPDTARGCHCGGRRPALVAVDRGPRRRARHRLASPGP